MKKFSLILLLVAITCTGFSQVVFGVKGGLNLATFTGNDVTGASMHPSFHVGGLVNFLVSDKITIQPEVLFSGKGTKADQGTYKLGYVNVPVMVQYNIQGFYLEAGPQVGFMVSPKFKAASSSETVNVGDILKTTDFSWVGGVGYKTYSGFGFGARYDFGFYNIANQGIIRNKTIMLSLFYTFQSSEE